MAARDSVIEQTRDEIRKTALAAPEGAKARMETMLQEMLGDEMVKRLCHEMWEIASEPQKKLQPEAIRAGEQRLDAGREPANGHSDASESKP